MSLSTLPVFAQLQRDRLVAVIRASTDVAAYEAARAVARGGVRFIEITYSVPDAPGVLRRLGRDGLDVVLGAGTVLTATQAEAAVDAGARFLIAPNCSLAVATVAHRRQVLFCPGAYTTSEIIAARDAGAQVVKVYPVGVAGGPAYLRVIRDPLPDIPMLAAGGTHLDNIVPFFEAGAIACGLGAALADPALAAAERFDEIEARAHAFVARAATHHGA
ncbi:MAG: bifunctional 4-hydroxy-2-oxoglutarate aldolase/2-dehydro-3-deoxy-phosphogluconate aldolase [Candidatus Eisenbacteria bacterium]